MKIFAIVGLAMAAAAMGAEAAEMIVVDALGVDLKPGQVVEGTLPLRLTVGQRVALMAQNGRILRLDGPSETAPESGTQPDDRSVLGALKDMVQAKQAKTSALGVSRTGRTALPAPWLLDVSASGQVCALEGAPLVLWRPDGQGDLPLTVSSGGVNARAVWPKGAQRLEGPAQIQPADGQTVTVTVGDRSAELLLRMVPAGMRTDEMRLAWLVEKDCLIQAAALARELD